MAKRKVIIVTDGDNIAREAVEEAAKNIGGRCISKTAGNPTPISGKEIVEHIKKTPYDPVILMVDDKGHQGMGFGEEAMNYIINHPDIFVMGVVAVASNTNHIRGIKVGHSIDKKGKLVKGAVDKFGKKKRDKIIKGDTVDILNDIKVPVVLGIGDPGKMDGYDSILIGSPILTKAMLEIIRRNDLMEAVKNPRDRN
ncbi:hypothetical protein OXPF_10360 [Oxobacter pfennigii]|uniref:Stage V sporulation protein AE n=1 Tax=Oxobacter pfennigii TaxID=36849 RepID=A0A0P8W9M6_9CLOT|nr:stage V sporulation protein AE [Oxobacter pfennigii]KPU45341.1 hypothetical protein OXPF_10360 [Oxobacter pfennigii]